ncbi:DUF1481 domain-containing protein [Dyella telluris]|uniref:DUF1481 domain-containing protein n=1 Tax=Dyella telluris TaxID=2763498 RepID=A0A7G8Q9S6_9GAMM|nr:DUF1481 domain-containing protein [Dyella telluris]QNK03534.1 DUF1481 domain-containing protein [Dyella telluris]
MRRLVWSLMSVAALALAGCGNSSQSPEGGNAAQAPAAANQVTGQVTLPEGSSVSATAKLDLTLIDVSQADSKPLATKTVEPANTLPVSFELPFNASDVNPQGMYVLQATLTDGDRAYKPHLQTPVLNGKPSTGLTVQLFPEQTPGEKELAAFTSVQKQIGGMKISNGTKLEDKVSRGWQVFREAGEVKFIREDVDYGDKGFTSTDYAYKDGKPWVVVQQKKASREGKASSTERAAWTADGNLVLKTNEQGGKSSPLADDEAASLQKQAQSILNLATGGKGK